MRAFAFLLVLASAPGGLAQAPPTADAAPAANEQLVRQKLRLLDHLLGSPTGKRIRTGTDAQAKQALEKIARMATDAGKALAAGAIGDAAPLVDRGLKEFSAAVKSLKEDKGQKDGAERARFQELRKGVSSFRESLLAVMQEQGDAAREVVRVEELDDLVARAADAFEAGQVGEANTLLGQAYEMTVAALSELRKNTTLHYTLEFETPVDEYKYEVGRAESNETLVAVLVERGAAAGSKGMLVERYVAKSQELRQEAAKAAEANDYEVAIELTREAIENLNRSLKLMGVHMTP